MTQAISNKRTLLLIAILLVAVISCQKDSPLEPPAIQQNPSPKGLLHGTWQTFTYFSKPSYLDFDSSTGRFMRQFDYDFNFTRELAGNFVTSGSVLTLNHVINFSSTFWYKLNRDTLQLSGDSLFTYTTSYVRTSPSPTLDGRSIKTSASWQHSYGSEDIWSLGGSDFGIFALTYYTGVDTYLFEIDTSVGVTHTYGANNIQALDVNGAYLWTVTDSSVQKRSIPSLAVVQSFRFREAVGIDLNHFYATGLAVNDVSCFLMLVNTFDAYPQGVLLQFTPTGSFISSTPTNSTIKDIGLINNRLFCCIGVEAFYELDPTSGMAIRFYALKENSSQHSVDSIAFFANRIFVVASYNFTMYSFAVPPV